MLTQKTLKRAVMYNPDTGIFSRRVAPSNFIRKNSVAGFTNKNGYIRVKLGLKSYAAHRLAFLYMEGSLPEIEVDHINHGAP